MTTTYTAHQIARWFLAYNNIQVCENGADLISNLKLQKLLYYAQGTFLGITGKKLFDDPILAWEHGSVIDSVYQTYKGNHSKGIEPPDDFDFCSIDKETHSTLESVYETFGQFSAWKLRNMTREESPWLKTAQNQEINTNLIKEYFLEHYLVS